MTALQLHKDIYSDDAISRAVSTFADYGVFNITPEDKDGRIQVDITPNDDIDEAELIGEFANYVLVDSVESTRLKK
jgi:hypothetical protein